jgi:hypothetical protein
MTNKKTLSNPRGGGRIKGKPCPNAVKYPGILAEIRFKYCQMRAQAKFRKEEFTLTWDEFQNLWQGRWHLRGRNSNSLCMTRSDWNGPWDKNNTIIVDRLEHLKMEAAHGVEKRRALKHL